MKRYLMLTFAGLALSLWSYLAGCTVVARPAPPPPPLAVQPQEPPMTTNVEPPPVREEVMVPAPSPQHVWIQGHWAWNGRWVWQPGYWVIPPRPYAKWVPGHWRRQPGGFGLGFLGIGDIGDVNP
jgi:hypothetical protein